MSSAEMSGSSNPCHALCQMSSSSSSNARPLPLPRSGTGPPRSAPRSPPLRSDAIVTELGDVAPACIDAPRGSSGLFRGPQGSAGAVRAPLGRLKANHRSLATTDRAHIVRRYKYPLMHEPLVR